MTWPLSRFKTFIDGVTHLTAADVYVIEDAIVALFGGTLGLKQLLVDGVGGAAVTLLSGSVAKVAGGFLELAGATDETTPAAAVETAPTNYRLVFRWKLASGYYARLYLGSSGVTGPGVTLTVGAAWNGANWVSDGGATQCARFILGSFGLELDLHALGTFADGAWSAFMLADSSGVTFNVGPVQTTGGQPIVADGSVTATTSYLSAPHATAGVLKLGSRLASGVGGTPVPLGTTCADQMIVACGKFGTGVDGAALMEGGVNISAVTHTAGTGYYQITLGVTLASAAVVLVSANGTVNGQAVWAYSGDRSHLEVRTFNAAGAPADVVFSLIVLGR